MTYKFSDRLREWTSYAGVAAAGLAYALPLFVPADTHWVQFWQDAQMLVGAALFFIPQTAGTTAVENDAWSLLRAFSSKVPPNYASAMQPLIANLAAHLAQAESGNSPVIGLLPTGRVMAQPVPNRVTQPVARPVGHSRAEPYVNML